ncbi:MAG: TlpA disulfide reductase family protein [Pseudomonadota bacterium]
MLIALATAGYGFISKPATPSVAFTTLTGQRINLADLRGKIVLVNFWATSCGICMAEMPDLVAAYRQYRERGFEVIAVAMPYDDPRQVREYAAKQGLPFPVVFDQDGGLAHEFGQVGATPTTFLIDRSGKRVSKTVGIINFDKLRAFLESVEAARP